MSRVEEFELLLRNNATLEPEMQRFMEQHTDYIPTFHHELHHGIWLNSVFSKPNIGPLKADFAFLTKHTTQRRIVLIELERPGKELFTRDKNYAVASADLNNALDQVRSWKSALKRDPGIINNFASLFDHAYNDTVDVKFTLVIGRTDDWASDPKKQAWISERQSSDDIIITGYDTIARVVKIRSSDHHLAPHLQAKLEADNRTCVLGQHVDGFTIKRLSGAPRHLLETLGPDRLHLSPEHRELFSKAGYDMNRWERGELAMRTARSEPFLTKPEARLKELIIAGLAA